MKKLEIGDKLYNKEYQRWGNSIYYKFATVERLTKTQAVLSNGVKLVNEPKQRCDSDAVYYSVFGDHWTHWFFQTPEIIEEARIERERQSIVRWFDAKKFTEDEKRIVYETFKDKDLLTPQMKGEVKQ